MQPEGGTKVLLDVMQRGGVLTRRSGDIKSLLRGNALKGVVREKSGETKGMTDYNEANSGIRTLLDERGKLDYWAYLGFATEGEWYEPGNRGPYRFQTSIVTRKSFLPNRVVAA